VLLVVGAVMVAGVGPACTNDDGDRASPPPAESAALADEPAPPAPPPPLSAEERVKKVHECWEALNRGREWTSCFAADAEAEIVDTGVKGPAVRVMAELLDGFPDLRGTEVLTMASPKGDRIVSVVEMKGTNVDPFMGVDPTGQRIGLLAAFVFDSNDQGAFTRATAYVDQLTMLGQLGEHDNPHRAPIDPPADAAEVVFSHSTEAEATNLAWVDSWTSAFNKHDAVSIAQLVPDDAVNSDQTMPEDTTGGRAVAAELGALFSAFPDIGCERSWAMAAGDYAALAVRCSGTNSGKSTQLGLRRPTGNTVTMNGLDVWRLDKGVMRRSWSFYNAMAIAEPLGLAAPPARLPAPAQ
jgi:predicted ester cyclase